MGNNFNRQFILTDFRLLDNREFLKFIGSAEYATYLVLRRYVWRSDKPHHMGLDRMYLDEKLLASSVDREHVAEITGVAPDNISRHLSSLTKKEIIRRVRTGRQNIFVLGEWIDVHQDGSFRGLEWFYLDGKFGVTKSDLTVSVRSDLTKTSDQNRPSASALIRRRASGASYIENRKENTVNGSGGKHPVGRLPDLDQPEEQTELVTKEIVEKLDDAKSERFYRLVASKVPYTVIHRTLSEIKADGADHPAKVFTYRMREYAERQLGKNS